MEKFATFSTTADVGIRITGNNHSDFYRNALLGLNSLLFGEEHPDNRMASTERISFVFSGDNCENVLVNFLSEIVFLLQTKGKYTGEIEFEEAGATQIKAKLATYPCSKTPDMEIKSVTYRNLRVIEETGKLKAEVIFDI